MDSSASTSTQSVPPNPKAPVIIKPEVPYISGTDLPLDDADIAIANFGPDADGFLIGLLAKELNYDPQTLRNLPTTRGFHLHVEKNRKPILFIKVSRKDPIASIKENLSAALQSHTQDLADKNIWLPTLWTSEGRAFGAVDPLESYNAEVQVLNSLVDLLPRTIFIISVPKRAQNIVDAIGSNVPEVLRDFKNLQPFKFWYSQTSTPRSKGVTEVGEIDQLSPDIQMLEGDKWSAGDWVISINGSGPFSVSIAKVVHADLKGINIQYKSVQDDLMPQKELESLGSKFNLSLPKPSAKRNFLKIGREFFVAVVKMTALAKYLPAPPKASDTIPFHLDQVVTDDQLSREPIAISLAYILNNEIFNREREQDVLPGEKKKPNGPTQAFMIHLQGAWGEGKSTFMKLLEKNLPTEKKKWIIVNFNAWQHQHIQPPWWTFLAEIYRQSAAKLNWFTRTRLFILEYFRRFILSKALTIFFVILFGSLLYFLRSPLKNFSESFYGDVPVTDSVKAQQPIQTTAADTAKTNAPVSNANTKTNTITPDKPKPEKNPLDSYLGLIAAVGTAIGLLYSLTKFLITPFFLSSPDDAISFMKRAADPMDQIKNHFKRLISNLNSFGYEVAIFIDDLDRCNDKFTIDLLEGIQTLFKDKGVLYVVAGDRHWITTCFENHYEKYKEVAREPGQKLGYLFLEKAFQLSVRLPNVSPENKMKYWQFILDPANYKRQQMEHARKNGKSMSEKIEELSPEAKAKAEQLITDSLTSGEVTGDVVDKFLADHAMDRKLAVGVILRAMDKSQEDVKHLLIDNASMIDSNPRSIIRLANQYTIYRNILTVEEKVFHRDKLFRWLVLQNKYPVFTDWLELNTTWLESMKKEELYEEKDLDGLFDDPQWMKLIQGKDGKEGNGPLKPNDIFTFMGGGQQEKKNN